MSANVRNLFDDLVVHVPAHLSAGDLVERAQADARRRRLRRRLVVAAAAAVAGLLFALMVPVRRPRVRCRARPVARRDRRWTGIPRGLNIQWPVRELPDRPGPLAGLLETTREYSDENPSPDSMARWHVFSATGRRWHLPHGPDHATSTRPVAGRDASGIPGRVPTARTSCTIS
jgi:hypothetical protein